jgi:hypothetical protein
VRHGGRNYACVLPGAVVRGSDALALVVTRVAVIVEDEKHRKDEHREYDQGYFHGNVINDYTETVLGMITVV